MTTLYQKILNLANLDNAQAQYLVGLCLYRGRGVRKNSTEATKWFYQSVEGGYMKAGHLIVKIYHEENTNPLVLEKAAKAEEDRERTTRATHANFFTDYYNKSEQDKTSNSIFNQALVLYNGKKFVIAAEYLLRAAKLGHKRAQYRLARMYKYGQGIPMDVDKALYWSETAKSKIPLL
ncbi:tetratricopeptide repeat protein [Candidatus Halobeggiatoa sp. HSG11]|nr:tetratricopeptide repeat protein [Candidatus Halobeggiatoa sp. HSG11]